MQGRRSRIAVLIAAGLSAGALTSAGLAMAAANSPSPLNAPAVEETPAGQGVGTPLADVSTMSTGTERFWGPECGDGEPTNHGGYVASTERDGETRSTAAHSPCGKPLSSVESGGGQGENQSGNADSHATGPHGQSGESHGQGRGPG
jgi:hypothetical protein